MKTIIIGTYYQILSFLRVKKAFFFAFLFPTFIFTVFSLVWGGENEDYSKFLLTGVIVLTTASDALFSIGGVIASFYRTGLIRFFKVTPYSYTKHIIALICSRIILFSTAIVLLVAYILNGTKLSCNEILYLIAGLILCIYIYAFMAFIISRITNEDSGNSSLMNFVFYGTVFLSHTNYPITELNSSFKIIVLLNPITPALDLSRGNFLLYQSVIWIILLWIAQYVCFNIQLKRK